MSEMSPLRPDYSLKEVAIALGMSEKWVRNQIKAGAEHLRYGHKIKFTAEQVDQLRSRHVAVTNPQPKSITTGRKRRTA